MTILKTCLSLTLVGATIIFARVANAAYDFSGLTDLAEGALVGENVDRPVAGFEIRLLLNGLPIYHQSFGAWSLDRPANADSSTKTLSGAAIMSIVDSGSGGFSLDSRLADFLPEYGNPGYRDITIRQAFSHTSGIAGDENSFVLQNPNITLRQAAWQIHQIPLAFTPGSTFAYGGLSMQATGAAAEVATGDNFVDLMADRITAPLGMTNTRFVLASQTNPRIAGGIETTATDFSRFMDMLANGGMDRATGVQILSTDAVNEMFTRQTNAGQAIAHSPTDNDRYGVGVWLDQLGEAGPPVDVLAAGARGFHSWIDQSHDLVFTFATDLSHFENLATLSSMMHTEILDTVFGSLPGDFNYDGHVDAGDYVIWRNGLGTTYTQDDYTIWRSHFGDTLGGGSVLPPSSVPEPPPSTLLLIGVTLGITMHGAHKRGQSYHGTH